VARSSPFAGLGAERPAPDALVVELGRPTRVALGCFGSTTVFLAAIALAAVSYAAFGVPGPRVAPPSLRVVAGVLGGIFLLIVAGLAGTVVRAVRTRQGLAVDGDAVWWRADKVLVRLPWSEIAAVRVVPPERVRGVRSSAPRTPSVEVCPVDAETIRRHPALADRVTGGPAALRLTFRLPSVADGVSVSDTLARVAPAQWAAGTTVQSAD
jgi:hypothetical protein